MLRAELYGMLLFGKTFGSRSIVFTTESSHAAGRLSFLLEALYRPIIERQNALRVRSGDSRLFRISVVGEDECRRKRAGNDEKDDVRAGILRMREKARIERLHVTS